MNRSKEEVAGEVYEKSLEMRHFRALAYPEEPKRGPSRATELPREEQDEENGFNGGRSADSGTKRLQNQGEPLLEGFLLDGGSDWLSPATPSRPRPGLRQAAYSSLPSRTTVAGRDALR